MPVFPRTLRPAKVTRPDVVAPFRSVAHGGALHVRNYASTVWTVWEERYPPLLAGDPDTEELLATIEHGAQAGVVYDVLHYTLPGSGLPPNGAGGGTPRVLGAEQYGGSLLTTGWPAFRTRVVAAGDFFRVDGVGFLLRASQDADTNARGVARVRFAPELLTAPDDKAHVRLRGVTVPAIIDDYWLPAAEPDGFYRDLRVTWRQRPLVF